MFPNPMAALEAYLQGDSTALNALAVDNTSLLDFINKQEPYSLSQKINTYLEGFCNDELVDLNFYKEGNLWTLDILTTLHFDALEVLPFTLIFPFIEKVKILHLNATNSIVHPIGKGHFLQACPHLKSLMISDKFFDKIYLLEDLLALELHADSIINIGAEISKIKHLKRLKIVGHYYIQLPENIAQLSDLEAVEYYVFNNDIGNNVLDLSRENLQKDLAYLSLAPALSSLSLTLDEYIKTLPELGLFKNIHNLYLYNISARFLEVLPEILASCTALKKLYVCLQSIPQNTKNLDQTLTLLQEKYDFSFEANSNVHDGKKYFSLVNTYY